MISIVGSKQASALLALHVMQELIKANYGSISSKSKSDVAISDIEEDILEYISGYILRKVNRYTEAKTFTVSETSGLVAAKDRGGLVMANENFIQIVTELEAVFRRLPVKCVDHQIFHSALACSNISSDMVQLLSDVETTPESKEAFFIDVCNLFFVMRAHQKCRDLVDLHVKATKKSRKTKALRDSI